MSERAGWRWFSYAPEDAKAAQAELNRLAEEGLELEEVFFCAAKFKRAAGRAPACWVEPARWGGDFGRNPEKREAYLALCGEAGWELADESRGMFWFKARPGADPVPLQTDGGVEWDSLWRRFLAERVFQLFFLGIYCALTVGRTVWQGGSRLWTAFFSDSTVAALGAVMLALLILVLQGLRALRYRGRCRRSLGAGGALPVPGRRSAQFRGFQWVVLLGLVCVMALSALWGVGERPGMVMENGRASWEYASTFGIHREYHDWDEAEYLYLDDYDCRFSWLAGWIVSDLVSDEGNQRYLDKQYTHRHDAADPEPANLGFDQSWTYPLGGGREGLIFRQGNRVLRIEAAAGLTGGEALAELRDWLAETG